MLSSVAHPQSLSHPLWMSLRLDLFLTILFSIKPPVELENEKKRLAALTRRDAQPKDRLRFEFMKA